MNYISITDAAKEKKVSRTSIYLAIATKKLDAKEVAGRQVIIKNQKYSDYRKGK